MVDYANVPQANALRQENELVTNAINMIDVGGTMVSFVINPPPSDPNIPSMPMMAASISTMESLPTPDTMLVIRNWLVQRSADITAQLAELGVTDPPDPPNPEPPPALLTKRE